MNWPPVREQWSEDEYACRGKYKNEASASHGVPRKDIRADDLTQVGAATGPRTATRQPAGPVATPAQSAPRESGLKLTGSDFRPQGTVGANGLLTAVDSVG